MIVFLSQMRYISIDSILKTSDHIHNYTYLKIDHVYNTLLRRSEKNEDLIL